MMESNFAIQHLDNISRQGFSYDISTNNPTSNSSISYIYLGSVVQGVQRESSLTTELSTRWMASCTKWLKKIDETNRNNVLTAEVQKGRHTKYLSKMWRVIEIADEITDVTGKNSGLISYYANLAWHSVFDLSWTTDPLNYVRLYMHRSLIGIIEKDFKKLENEAKKTANPPTKNFFRMGTITLIDSFIPIHIKSEETSEKPQSIIDRIKVVGYNKLNQFKEEFKKNPDEKIQELKTKIVLKHKVQGWQILTDLLKFAYEEKNKEFIAYKKLTKKDVLKEYELKTSTSCFKKWHEKAERDLGLLIKTDSEYLTYKVNLVETLKKLLKNYKDLYKRIEKFVGFVKDYEKDLENLADLYPHQYSYSHHYTIKKYRHYNPYSCSPHQQYTIMQMVNLIYYGLGSIGTYSQARQAENEIDRVVAEWTYKASSLMTCLLCEIIPKSKQKSDLISEPHAMKIAEMQNRWLEVLPEIKQNLPKDEEHGAFIVKCERAIKKRLYPSSYKKI
jgi:hypothetical protein